MASIQKGMATNHSLLKKEKKEGTCLNHITFIPSK